MTPISKTGNQLFLFIIVGVIGTAGHYLTLVTLVEVSGWPPIVATSLGFLVGALINYFLNYYYTFRSKSAHKSALVRFLTIAAVGAFLNTSLFYLIHNKIGIHYLIAQISATGTVLFFNFTFQKSWAFGR